MTRSRLLALAPRSGAVATTVSKKPARWLVAKLVSMPSAVSTRSLRASAALRIRPSRRGVLSMISYARDLTSCINERFAATTSRLAFGTRLRIRSAAISPRSAVRAPKSTRAPRSPSWLAMASPRPLVAPVTRNVGRRSEPTDSSVTGGYYSGPLDHDHRAAYWHHRTMQRASRWSTVEA
jgi:hypothetical protein